VQALRERSEEVRALQAAICAAEAAEGLQRQMQERAELAALEQQRAAALDAAMDAARVEARLMAGRGRRGLCCQLFGQQYACLGARCTGGLLWHSTSP